MKGISRGGPEELVVIGRGSERGRLSGNSGEIGDIELGGTRKGKKEKSCLQRPAAAYPQLQECGWGIPL